MRTEAPVHLTMWQTGECLVITFPAEVDPDNATKIRDRLLQVLNRGVEALVLDLSETTFCDSSGVNAILRAYVRAKAAHIPFLVVLPDHGPVRTVCEITGVSKIAEVAASVAEARRRLIRSRASAPKHGSHF